ncbi:MAG: LysM peptidoglycan-binding domain-containing protein [Chlamydiota bacterium]
MNRRDIIIAAALVNVGLLIVLVVASVKREPKQAVVMPSRTVADLEIPVTLAPTLSNRDHQHLPLSPKPSLDARKESAPNKVAAKVAQEKKRSNDISKIKAQQMPVSPASECVVIVKKGDVLEKIAKTHCVTVEAILSLNQLKTTRLQIGQRLKIPVAKQTKKEKTLPVSQKQHIVKEGENPWTIAKQYKMKVEDLLQLNNLTEQEAKKLRPGRSLRVE